MHIPKKIAGGVLLGCLLAAGAGKAAAQEGEMAPKAAVGSAQAPAEVYGKLLTGLEQEFVSLAEAMPEDKYNFAPTEGEFKGVRSFGEQVKHVAEANGYFFHNPDEAMKDDSAAIEKLKTKAEMVAALKESFKEAHAYVDAITPENAFVMTKSGTRAGMAAFGMAHLMDHYGQLVVYLRMNGIVPPASRKSGQ